MKKSTPALIFVSAACLIVSTTPSAWAELVADGRLAPSELSEYSHFLSISWQTNLGDQVDGGLLGLGTNPNTGNHFLYYQLPVDYKDNTWGSETTGPWGDEGHQVGEYGTNPHTVYKIWQGDQLGGTGTGNRIVLRPTDGSAAVQFNVDLLASDASAGTANNTLLSGQLGDPYLGDKGLFPSLLPLVENNGTLLNSNATKAAYFINVATSTSWNINHFGPVATGGTGDISQDEIDAALNTPVGSVMAGLLKDSPEVTTTVDAGNLVDSGFTRIFPGDSTSPIIDYDNVAPAFDDWWFPAAFEIELAASLFPDGDWLSQVFLDDLVNGNAGDALLWIPRGGHISPNKFNATSIQTPNLEIVPEPSSLALLILGGLSLLRRRR